jgi:hypothetical protein
MMLVKIAARNLFRNTRRSVTSTASIRASKSSTGMSWNGSLLRRSGRTPTASSKAREPYDSQRKHGFS